MKHAYQPVGGAASPQISGFVTPRKHVGVTNHYHLFIIAGLVVPLKKIKDIITMALVFSIVDIAVERRDAWLGGRERSA